MAGEWIPMRVDLADDPAVIAIADRLGLDQFGVVGRLHRLWGWANAQLADGNADGVTSQWIDHLVSTPDFASTLAATGWLHVRSGGVLFPKFDVWNSQNAKKRLKTARRVRNHRVENCNAPGVTKALPEKRREEKNKEDPPTPHGGVDAPPRRRQKKPAEEHPRFAEFWDRYPRRVGRPNAAGSYLRAAIDEATADAILAGLERWRRSEAWTHDGGKYIPHPTTFLNQRRWEDDPEPAKLTPPPPPSERVDGHGKPPDWTRQNSGPQP